MTVRDELTLAGGSTVVVGLIRGADAAALVVPHARPSSGTIYRRYCGSRPHLAEPVGQPGGLSGPRPDRGCPDPPDSEARWIT